MDSKRNHSKSFGKFINNMKYDNNFIGIIVSSIISTLQISVDKYCLQLLAMTYIAKNDKSSHRLL